MDNSITAESTVRINASPERVWHVLTTPALVKKWFFGAEVITTWQKGSPIVFKGEWGGSPYEDKGVILDIQKNSLLAYTHLSSRTGQTDVPENYETVTFALSKDGEQTVCTVHEANLASVAARDTSLGIWAMVLESLKEYAQVAALSSYK